MTPPRVVDVSGLPTFGFGARDPLTYGVVALAAIETTMFALCWASALYLRGNFAPFPPTPLPGRVVAAGGIELALLLATIPPTLWMNAAARRGRLRPMRRTIGASLVLQALTLAVRAYTLSQLPFRWDTHAHGSVFWLTVGLHTMHALTGLVEEATLFALLWKGPVLQKHRTDVEATGTYWLAVVAWWIPTYALLYLDPVLLARGGAP